MTCRWNRYLEGIRQEIPAVSEEAGKRPRIMQGGNNEVDMKVYSLLGETVSFHAEIEEQMDLASSTIQKEEEAEVKEDKGFKY